MTSAPRLRPFYQRVYIVIVYVWIRAPLFWAKVRLNWWIAQHLPNSIKLNVLQQAIIHSARRRGLRPGQWRERNQLLARDVLRDRFENG